MSNKSSATPSPPAVLPTSAAGLAWGLLGVVAFSFTVPLTRVSVGSLSPLLIGSGRAVIAAALAGAALALTRQARPRGNQWVRLDSVAGGIVIGFPFFTSFAMSGASAGHGAVVIALLPAATAVMAVLRTGERPPRSFWALAGLGAVAAVAFASLQGGGFGTLGWPDLLLFGAVIAGAIGYAEGACWRASWAPGRPSRGRSSSLRR